MDAFAELFADRPSKILAIAYSTILSLVLTPMLFSMIWFERDNHNRTLINQLMGSIW